MALNQAEAEDLDARYQTRRICVLPNVTPDAGGARATAPTPGDVLQLIFVGRLQARKRPGLCLDALSSLRSRNLDAKLTFVGPDEGEEADLIATAKARGLEDKISILGGVSHVDVIRLLANSHIFLFTPQDEPHGLVLAEAGAVGLPSVVVPGVPLGVAYGAAGAAVIASDGTGDAMAEAILALTQKDAWSKASDACRRLSSAQDVSEYTRNLLDSYGMS